MRARHGQGGSSTRGSRALLWFCSYLLYRKACNEMRCSPGDPPWRGWEPSEEEISHGAKCTFGRRSPAVTGTCVRWRCPGPRAEPVHPAGAASGAAVLQRLPARLRCGSWDGPGVTLGRALPGDVFCLGTPIAAEAAGSEGCSRAAPRRARPGSPASRVLAFQRSALEFKLN